MPREGWPDWDIYIRDRATCVYCGFDGRDDLRNWRQLQIDHVVPTSQGGPDRPGNKVVSCVRCNVMKGQRDPRAMLEGGETADLSVLVAAARRLIDDVALRNREVEDYEAMMAEIRGGSAEGSEPPDPTGGAFSLP